VTTARLRREILLQLSGDPIHFLGFWKGVLLRGNIGPFCRIFRVQFQPLIEARFSVGADRLGRAFRFTYAAVDALVGIDDEHVFAFVETIDRADLDAVRIFAANAIIGHDIRHRRTPVAARIFEQAAYLSYSFAPIFRQADNQPGALEYLAAKWRCTDMVAGISPCPFMPMPEVTILSRRDKGTNAAISRSHPCLKRHFV